MLIISVNREAIRLTNYFIQLMLREVLINNINKKAQQYAEPFYFT